MGTNRSSASCSVEGDAEVSFDDYIQWHNEPASSALLGNAEEQLQTLTIVEVGYSNITNVQVYWRLAVLCHSTYFIENKWSTEGSIVY